MRFFPYVSSCFRGTIEISPPEVQAVTIDVPDRYRMRWWPSKVLRGDAEATRRHSKGEARSTFLFTWPETTRESDLRSAHTARISVDVPFRLGGISLSRIVEFPLYFLLISQVAIAAAAAVEDARIVVFAVSGTWAAILREWSRADASQRGTIMTGGYLAAGLAVAVAALLDRVCLPAAIAFGLLTAAMVIAVVRITRSFGHHGRLPPRVERAAQSVIRWSVLRQQKTEGWRG
jgi:hypothetical protein